MRLVINPLADVVPDANGLRVRVQPLGTHLVVTPLQASLLELFRAPHDLDELLASEPRARAARAMFDDAVSTHVLVPVDERDQAILPNTCATELTFLGAPPLRDAGATDSDVTFAFLGVPWDRDVSGRAGARFGPAAVRAASAGWAYGIDAVTRRPVGFFDLGAQERVLDGAAFVDAGDVIALPGDSKLRVHERVTAAVRAVIDAGAIPLVVGGDHSITRPVLTGVIDALRAQEREAEIVDEDPVWIVHFDAHTDLGDAKTGDDGRLELHHGNVMTVVLEECSRVQGIAQIGLRGLVKHAHHEENDSVVAFGMDELDSIGVDDILDVIPEGALCWFSVDIDVVDPAYAPSTGTPVPGGMTPRRLWQLVAAIAQQRVCLGIDLVEIAEPHGPADGTASIGATCLMRFAHAMVQAERAALSEGADDAEAE